MKLPPAALTMLAATLVMMTTIIAAAEGQGPPRNPNFVDTITVARLPTGGCEWEKAARRIRPGKPGTTTVPGPANEKTCTVVAYNYTSGSAHEPPAVVAFAYVQDHKRPPPKNAVFNFADTFTVARRPDGNCDWAKSPLRPGQRGSTSYLGEVRTKDCWGVVYNVTYPPQDTTGMKTSVSVALPSGVWEQPDTLEGRGRQARDIANAASAVVPRGAHIEQMTITDDSLANVVVFNPGSTTEGYRYYFRKRGSRWVPAGKPEALNVRRFAPPPRVSPDSVTMTIQRGADQGRGVNRLTRGPTSPRTSASRATEAKPASR